MKQKRDMIPIEAVTQLLESSSDVTMNSTKNEHKQMCESNFVKVQLNGYQLTHR